MGRKCGNPCAENCRLFPRRSAENLAPKKSMLPIVYVHLGDKPAPHLIDSIRQSRRMSKSADIYVIVTQNTAMAAAATEAGARVVYAERLPPTASHRLYMNRVRRRLGKKRGFWRFATERFFFIEEFMIAEGGDRVLHLELDNLIFFDPAEIEERMQALYPGMAAPFWNDTMCIPGVVYVGDRKALADLTAYLARRVTAERDSQLRWYRPKFLTRVRMGLVLNDMNMLAAFRAEYGSDMLNNLPMVPPDYDIENSRVPHDYDYSYGFGELGMVFDGLTFGPAIDGFDPAHHTAAAGDALLRDYSYIDSTAFGYDRLDLRDRTATPHLTFRGREVRLASVHNHAKAKIT